MTLAPVHHILPLTTIVRERVLPVKGKVLVHLSQKVVPSDIVAEATWAREHIFLDVARTLNISADAADKLTHCQTGDKILAGETIAAGRGVLRSFPIGQVTSGARRACFRRGSGASPRRTFFRLTG